MRPVLPGDVSAAARALLPVPRQARPDRARRLIDEACVADAHCRQTGRAHARWGNGTLMAAAYGHPMGHEISFDDPDYLDCQVRVLEALRAYSDAEAQEKEHLAVGPNSSCLPANSPPHPSQ